MLLDGRRIVPANGAGVVDANVIPASLVESVEVIRGGASAVRGSDAIAGVVNFKLKRKFDGIQFDGGWGQADQGDGAEYSVGLTAGTSFADGRGEVIGYVGAGEGTLGPSQRPDQAAIDALFASYGSAPGSVSRVGNSYTVNADGTVFSTGTGALACVINFRGERDPYLAADRRSGYNFAPWNYLQLPLERISVLARAAFEAGSAGELSRDVDRGWRLSGVRA